MVVVGVRGLVLVVSHVATCVKWMTLVYDFQSLSSLSITQNVVFGLLRM